MSIASVSIGTWSSTGQSGGQPQAGAIQLPSLGKWPNDSLSFPITIVELELTSTHRLTVKVFTSEGLHCFRPSPQLLFGLLRSCNPSGLPRDLGRIKLDQ